MPLSDWNTCPHTMGIGSVLVKSPAQLCSQGKQSRGLGNPGRSAKGEANQTSGWRSVAFRPPSLTSWEHLNCPRYRPQSLLQTQHLLSTFMEASSLKMRQVSTKHNLFQFQIGVGKIGTPAIGWPLVPMLESLKPSKTTPSCWTCLLFCFFQGLVLWHLLLPLVEKKVLPLGGICSWSKAMSSEVPSALTPNLEL